MWDEYLVAKLTPKASQVLLFLLVRQGETPIPQAEFAIHTGLSRRSISSALRELGKFGLVRIITQAGKTSLVEPMFKEYTAHPEPAPEASQVVEEDEETHIDTPMSMCEAADESGDRARQVVALQAVWDEAFPKEIYPFQRLTKDTAKQFLVNRSAAEIARVIQDAVSHSQEPIKYPRSYITSALARMKPNQEVEVEPVITDDLRKLAMLGRKQHEAKAIRTYL